MFTSILIAMTLSGSWLSVFPQGQEDATGSRPLASQRRLVRTFDFEAAGLQGRVPAAWGRLVDRPGYPKFGTIGVDGTVAAEGRFSLRFNVDGGSMAVAIRTGEILIFPQSRYELTARVRTVGLANAAARLAVSLHDQHGSPIPGTERLSDPIRTEGDWATVSVQPPMDVSEARDLVFEMRVEQPDGSATGTMQHIDVSGTAWFDDVEVWQLPRIDFTADPPSGIARSPESPRLRASLRDLVDGKTTATIRVRDIDGMVVLERSEVVTGGRSDFEVSLDALAPGWYHGEFDVRDEERLVASGRQPVAILPERSAPGSIATAPFFGISLEAGDDMLLASRHQAMIPLRPDYAVLPVWQHMRSSVLDHDAQERLDRMIEESLAANIEPVFELAAVPRDLADREHLDPDQLLTFLATAPDAWQSALGPWMLNFGDEVSRWRIRSSDRVDARVEAELFDRLALFADEHVADPVIEFDGITNVLAASTESGTPSKVVRIPWGAHSGSGTAAVVPPAVSSGSILRFELPDDSDVSWRSTTEELSRRLIEGWASGAELIEITPPWTVSSTGSTEGATSGMGLDVAGFAFEEVASWLSGRPPEAELPVGRGLRAVLAGGDGPPVIVAWAEDDSSFGLPLGMGLGADSLRVHDFMGGTRELTPAELESPLPLGTAPILIEGIDPELARFRASASLHPEAVDAATGSHDLEIELFNPWDEPIDLRVRPTGPGNWTFQPRSRQVSIGPGEHVRVPFEFSYPRKQVDGAVDFWFEARFEDEIHEPVLLLLPSRIESERIQMETTWNRQFDESGRAIGVLVTVRAYNTGSKPLNLEAFASARGYPPMRKWMPELDPGESATRTFLLRNADERLVDEELLVGVNGFDDGARLTRRLQVTTSAGSVVGVDPSAAP